MFKAVPAVTYSTVLPYPVKIDGLRNTSSYAFNVAPCGYQIIPLTCTIHAGSLREANSTNRNGYSVTDDNRNMNSRLNPSNTRSPQLRLINMVYRLPYQSLVSLVFRLIAFARKSSVKLMRELNSPTAAL